MIPLVFRSRTEVVGGLWTPKLFGDFEEGDPATTRFFIEGRVEMKELGGHLKLFFKDVRFTERKLVITDEERYMMFKEEADKLFKVKVTKFAAIGEVYEEEDETEDEKKERLAKAESAVSNIIRERKEVHYPKLYVYLSRKRPKRRMVDLHKTGAKIPLMGDIDGQFGKRNTLGDFEVPLKDIPDVLGYQGLVVMKLPQDEPKTDEPVIFGMIRFSSARTQKIKTIQSLQLADLKDEMGKVLDSVGSDARAAVSNKKKLSECLKSLTYYRQMSNKAWIDCNKPQDYKIDFSTFLKILDNLNLFLVEVQAKRLFDSLDVAHENVLDIIQFEKFLMAYDVIGNESDLLILDIYDTFKVEPSKEFAEIYGNKKGIDYSGFCEACQLLEVTKSALQRGQEQIEQGNNFIKGANKEEAKDFEKEDEMEDAIIMGAFCSAASAKPKDINETFLTLEQFKVAWLKLANLEKELVKRQLKYDKISLSESRNRERLNRYITDQENKYLGALGKINEILDDYKRDKRLKREEKKKELNAFREKLHHEAQRFIAARNQEKRLQMKQDEDERLAKRAEERAFKTRMQEKQDEAKANQATLIASLKEKSETLRLQEIEKHGWNRMDHSMQRYRYVPSAHFDTEEARTLLSYAVIIDYSNNVLDCLPESNFAFWMQSVRKLKLSKNRIKRIPREFCDSKSLESLELDSNHLLELPEEFGNLVALRRLDISNNKLTLLPESFGFCCSLSYLSAHSNNFLTLPSSIGQCFRLEYLDLSGNSITELPESVQFLANLVYLNLSSNRLGHLPRNFGGCTKLRYLDLTNNDIAAFPDSFSQLTSLEICFVDRNQLTLARDCFNNCTMLRKLTMRYNQSRRVFSDIGFCSSLSYLDLSHNNIEYICPEIGLLKSLEELHLSHNRLLTFPPEFGACIKLYRLELSSNEIKGMLPDTIGLLESLRSLSISVNHIDELPRSIIGLQHIEELIAEKCRLSFLPDTIVYLQTLVTIDLPDNYFREFPVLVLQLKALKRLNLRSNMIRLLPREICVLSSLTFFDIGRNQLQSLPVEFADILDSVPETAIDGNPWTDLPPKWGKINVNTKGISEIRVHESFSRQGYSVAEVLDFLYSMRLFYYEAEDIWKSRGAYYYSQKLSLNDFLDDLRRVLPAETYKLISFKHVEMLFFKAREFGVFPIWYCVNQQTLDAIQLRKEADAVMRELKLRRAEKDVRDRVEMTRHAYDDDVVRRANRAREISEEYLMNEAIAERKATVKLQESVGRKNKANDKRRAKHEKELYVKECIEMDRLKEILLDDLKIRKKYEHDPDDKYSRVL